MEQLAWQFPLLEQVVQPLTWQSGWCSSWSGVCWSGSKSSSGSCSVPSVGAVTGVVLSSMSQEVPFVGVATGVVPCITAEVGVWSLLGFSGWVAARVVPGLMGREWLRDWFWSSLLHEHWTWHYTCVGMAARMAERARCTKPLETCRRWKLPGQVNNSIYCHLSGRF